MILELLIGTIAVATPVTAPPRVTAPPPPTMLARQRLSCRAELGTASLVQRVRICHPAAEWRAIDARRRARPSKRA